MFQNLLHGHDTSTLSKGGWGEQGRGRRKFVFVEKLLEFSWLFYSRVMGRRVAWVAWGRVGALHQGLAGAAGALQCDRHLAAMWSQCEVRTEREGERERGMFLIFLQSANAKRFVYAASQRGLLRVFA